MVVTCLFCRAKHNTGVVGARLYTAGVRLLNIGGTVSDALARG